MLGLARLQRLALRLRDRRTPVPASREGFSVNVFANLEDDWILNTVAEAVARHSKLPANLVHHPEWTEVRGEAPFRSAVGGFFTHYALYREYLKEDAPRADVVFFTHFWPRDQELERASAERAEMLRVLQQAVLVISMSSHGKRLLVEWGLPEQKVAVELLGADANRFPLSQGRSEGRLRVGLVSAYKDLKNGPFLLRAVERHPELDWILLGKNWEKAPGGLLDRLKQRPNFQYRDIRSVPFARWPEVYRDFDLFLSPSLAEGGPIPLLEAMLGGTWPLASDTGHARDVIRGGENGCVFAVDNDSDFEEKLRLSIPRVRERSQAVRESVLPLTWERFGRAVDARVERLLAEAAR